MSTREKPRSVFCQPAANPSPRRGFDSPLSSCLQRQERNAAEDSGEQQAFPSSPQTVLEESERSASWLCGAKREKPERVGVAQGAL